MPYLVKIAQPPGALACCTSSIAPGRCEHMHRTSFAAVDVSAMREGLNRRGYAGAEIVCALFAAAEEGDDSGYAFYDGTHIDAGRRTDVELAAVAGLSYDEALTLPTAEIVNAYNERI